MSLLSDAIDRLQNLYNDGAYDVTGNPGGFDVGGHRLNFLNAGRDVATVGDNLASAGLLSVTTADRSGTAGAAAPGLNSDIAQLIAAGGGTLQLPKGIYDTSGTLILVDLSAITTRFQGRIIIEGEGVGSIIRNNSGSCFKFLGRASNPEAYFELRNIRFQGNNVATSTGVELNKGALIDLRNVVIESFDLGLDATDVDQIGIYDSEIRFNAGGVRINAAVSVTDANSWTFVNSSVGNNSVYGLQVTNANAFSWFGGTIQYNGVIGGGSGQYGILMSDTGSGYGTVLFSGMVFEGNGGAGDFLSQQVSAGADHCNVTFDTVSFMRTVNFVTVGYGTNQVKISGTQPDANYKFINCNFYGKAGYVASVGRPAIANTNTNARIEIDGLTKFWSATEAPTTREIYAGYPGLHTGRIKLAGATSGEGTLTGPAAASTFLWTLPSVSGTLLTAAAQSDQEAASSTALAVTSGRQQFHPSAAKAWGKMSAAGTLLAGYNCSTSKLGTGNFRVTFTNAFSSANYSIVLSAGLTGGGTPLVINTGPTPGAGSFDLFTFNLASVLTDPGNPAEIYFACYGDQ